MPKEVMATSSVVDYTYESPDGKQGFSTQVRLGVHIGWTSGAGEPPQIGITGWPYNPGPEVDTESFELPGYFADLSWAQCNTLITILRRARDGAYGKPQ